MTAGEIPGFFKALEYILQLHNKALFIMFFFNMTYYIFIPKSKQFFFPVLIIEVHVSFSVDYN